MTSSSPSDTGYKLPGRTYWIKRVIFYIVLKKRKRQQDRSENKDSPGVSSNRGYGLGVTDPDVLEPPQQLKNHPFAIDGKFFAGYGADDTRVVFRLARRPDRRAEIWMYLDLPGIGPLQHPVHPDTDLCNVDGEKFSAGGLTFEMLQPMLRWKVSYSGQLRVGLCNDIKNKPDKFVHVSLSLIWTAFSGPFNFDTDVHPAALSDAIAREDWNKEYFHKLKSLHQTHYEQWGELRGTISVEGYEDRPIYIKTVTDHSFGTRDWRAFRRYIVHFIYVESGLVAQIAVVSHETMSHLKVGYLFYPNGDLVSVSNVSLNMWEVGEDGQPPKDYTFSFVAGGKEFSVHVQGGVTPVWYHQEDRGGKVMQMFCKFTINGKAGRGSTEFFYRNDAGPARQVEASIPLLSEACVEDIGDYKDCLVLDFSDVACSVSAIVGGKGSQLPLLTQVEKQVDMKVPEGICLTLKAFQAQLEVRTKSWVLRKISLAGTLQELQTACSNTVTLLKTTSVHSELQTAIMEGLVSVFDGKVAEKRFAVRSSAAGEDGSDVSSAGQMETFLGVLGSIQLLADAVRKCWASAFTFQAVEYRRQHGQPLDAPVGVVIQEMIPSDVSGVLFTHEPMTGNPCQMVINASYGLCESIVSGKTNPDIFLIHRTWDDQLEIVEKKLGDKQMVIKMADSGGVEELTTDSSKAAESCLTDKEILRLSRIGVKLEKYFGSGRDIEWAITNNIVYLLQCRPITAQEHESDEDLIHEFDSAMASDRDWLTTGNIGEMMPKAVTPLTWSVFVSSVEMSLQELFFELKMRRSICCVPTSKHTGFCCNHVFLSIMMGAAGSLTTAGSNKSVVELNILGQKLPELTMDQILEYYGEKLSAVKKLINLFYMLKGLSDSHKKMRTWYEKIQSYIVGEGRTSAESLYREICLKLHDLTKVTTCSLFSSTRSGCWPMILMSILSQGKEDWTMEMYGDVALLLSKCPNVYSADVPNAIPEIVNEGLENTFLNLSDSECADLLISDKNKSLQKKTTSFFEKHGHRCIREMEMREESWETNPAKLMSVLKAIIKSKSYCVKQKEVLTVQEVISQMQVPITTTGKWILKFVLPRARAAVGEREYAKSLLVKMNDHMKKAYRRLANLMVQEGRLPDADLIHFMTHYEIGRLLQTRSPKIIMRASKRRKIYPQQMLKTFTKTFQGHPQPLPELKDDQIFETVAQLKGLPISIGKVRGTARVVLSLDDAENIQAGDILVVMVTDVGWTPYFPLIGGLITEMGGTISHGAVVAREYGIPCVVNVAMATRHIKSGELLLLDGRKGTINKLSQTNQNTESN
ncbi:putative phosphoenolpyruvate synthase [Gigantopelta aegis]|uniref:putative phosphoenolpyruvate synthase n=1 Tax=Gigantopelta aegis TaxID=1735272 RepID=UPI001B889DA1|nr:putative phosphoenolpyruvate synthase [Gigantopelta aegis]